MVKNHVGGSFVAAICSKVVSADANSVASIVCGAFVIRPGPEVIKLFLFLTQPSRKFILLINVTMPIIVGILTFINMIIQHRSERLKERKVLLGRYFIFYEQLKCSENGILLKQRTHQRTETRVCILSGPDYLVSAI